MLHIVIIDNGIGRSSAEKLKKNKQHKSMAMKITRDRIDNLNKKYKTDGFLHIEDLNKNSKKTLDNLEARTALGVLVSKKLKEALYIAENAARGIYPSNEKIRTGLEFDGDEIYRIEKNNTALFFLEMKDRNKVGLGYHLTAIAKKYQRKQASNRKMEQEIERQVQIHLSSLNKLR